MRGLVITLFFLCANTSAALTITFDQVEYADYGMTGPARVITGGFEFDTGFTDILNADSGILLFGSIPTINIARSNGDYFALQSMELNQLAASDYLIVGYFVAGGTVQLSPSVGPGPVTVLFDSAWQNLSHVELSTISGGGFSTLDNVEVTVPAGININFDGASMNNGTVPVPPGTVLTVPQGFEVTGNSVWFYGTTALGGFCPVTPGPPSVGNFLCAIGGGHLLPGPNLPVELDFVRTDGSLFSLLEMDIYLVAPEFIGEQVFISAWDSNDNLIAQTSANVNTLGVGWHTLQFGPEWAGISRLTYTGQEEIVFEPGSYIYLDNIRVNVHIPAVVDVIGTVHPHHRGQGGLPNDTVSVAVMGSSTLLGDPVDLDASLIDPDSVRFGPSQAMIDPASTPDLNYNHDGDGTPDARLEFKMNDIGFPYTPGSGYPCSASPAELNGELATGELFMGVDSTVNAQCNASCH